jgi:tetratricopeptide (TPR) repeat protein
MPHTVANVAKRLQGGKQMRPQETCTRRNRLSVAMIARNEEAFLADSIESVQTFADEIVVLDTGSTDGTRAVAESLGAVVESMPWPHDFSAARNHCLELLTGDWALWLDAGERVSADSAATLRAFVDRKADPDKAYRIMIEIPLAGGGIAGEEVARPRLMPTGVGLKFQGRVRETLRPAIDAAHMGIETAPGRITRHRRQHDQAWKTLKGDRDLTLVALETVEHAAPVPRLLLAEAAAYANMGMLDQARQAFRAAIDALPCASTEMLEAYYGLMTCYACDPFLGHHQLGVCLEALEIYPVDTQLLLALGNCLSAANRSALAIRAFETAVHYGQVNVETWHLCGIEQVAEMCLNAALGLGKPEPVRPAPGLPTEDGAGHLLRIHQHGVPHEVIPPRRPMVGEAFSSETIS